MIRSLPGTPERQLKALRAPIRLPGRGRGAAIGIGVKVLPRIPDRVKRLLFWGRSITIDGNTLDPTLQLMLAALRVFGINGLVGDEDPARARAGLRELLTVLPGPQIHVAVNEVSLPGPAGAIRARHYLPPGAGPAPLLVFYHGGGWALGDLDTHDALCRLTCRDAGIHVLSIDYRLGPEHPAPAAVDDAYAAFRWAREHAAELGAIDARVAVGGDSAGGNLAAVVAQRARDDAVSAPVLQWLLYPRTDFTAHTRSLSLFSEGFLLTKHDLDWFTAQYLGGSGIDPADPRVSPLRADTLTGLAPALIAIAGFDPLRDEGEQYATALRTAGTAVDLRVLGSLTHGFASLFRLGGGSATATRELISALRAHLSRI
ncbi:MAG: alpha/beta hydrolase [Mycobacterium sp.]|uniref:alpha/beta hydrolase n=1 Tax=Mycobacterium sp. TaxID=1785 RepID=UPI00262ACBC7|nr:alpha/beta hydrolase [Mycobacterium sp.]MDI3314274.1 alpha/beta hydrolase [Mycobacterium sp.]